MEKTWTKKTTQWDTENTISERVGYRTAIDFLSTHGWEVYYHEVEDDKTLIEANNPELETTIHIIGNPFRDIIRRMDIYTEDGRDWTCNHDRAIERLNRYA